MKAWMDKPTQLVPRAGRFAACNKQLQHTKFSTILRGLLIEYTSVCMAAARQPGGWRRAGRLWCWWIEWVTVGAFRGFSQSISRQQFHDDSPHWAKEEFAHESMKLFLLLTRKYKSSRYANSPENNFWTCVDRNSPKYGCNGCAIVVLVEWAARPSQCEVYPLTLFHYLFSTIP